MTFTPSEELSSRSVARLSLAFRPRGVSIHYVVFALLLSASFWTLYYPFHQRTTVLFPEGWEYYQRESPHVWAGRATQVKNAFLHAYHGYERHAAPADELLPVFIISFNGWGVTAIDSLDTMLIMGLEEEYKRALSIVHQSNFSVTNIRDFYAVPFFETVIRYLGGLLSAYAMSGDNILRTRADELGTVLASAFDTPSGFPRFGVDTTRKVGVGGPTGFLAEIASFQIEYTYLGKITGKKEHVDRATNITRLFSQSDLRAFGGMYPARWDLRSGLPADGHLSVGASADSAHEYTLKQYLLTAKSDRANLEMYLRATTHIINNLLFLSPKRNLLYVTDMHTRENITQPTHDFEHLSCFLPGLLALGAHTLPLDRMNKLGVDFMDLGTKLFPNAREGYTTISSYNIRDLHLWAAEGLAQTCWLMYADQLSGIGPDVVLMESGQGYGEYPWMEAVEGWRRRGARGPPPGVGHKLPVTHNIDQSLDQGSASREYTIKTDAYFLRPETVESFYLLWRTTGNVRWRHHGWAIFQAIEREAKTTSGYASLENVTLSMTQQIDSMPSYFLAETLKYLYLLFIDEDILPLNKWVFNTEAHPLPVFDWSQAERVMYGIL